MSELKLWNVASVVVALLGCGTALTREPASSSGPGPVIPPDGDLARVRVVNRQSITTRVDRVDVDVEGFGSTPGINKNAQDEAVLEQRLMYVDDWKARTRELELGEREFRELTHPEFGPGTSVNPLISTTQQCSRAGTIFPLIGSDRGSRDVSADDPRAWFATAGRNMQVGDEWDVPVAAIGRVLHPLTETECDWVGELPPWRADPAWALRSAVDGTAKARVTDLRCEQKTRMAVLAIDATIHGARALPAGLGEREESAESMSLDSKLHLLGNVTVHVSDGMPLAFHLEGELLSHYETRSHAKHEGGVALVRSVSILEGRATVEGEFETLP